MTILKIQRLKGSIIYCENIIIVLIEKLLLHGSFKIELFRNYAYYTHTCEVLVLSEIL